MVRIDDKLIPIIAGPTAGRKTELAVELALAWPGGGEVISADSMQIYQGLDIGTAKPTEAEQRGVPHHLIGIVDPAAMIGSSGFTVDDWLMRAEKAVDEVHRRGSLPIVAGGTNLYLQAFLYGLFDGPSQDPTLREELAELPLAELRLRLEQADPVAAERIHPNDKRRAIRALEVFRQTGVPISVHQQQWQGGTTRSGCRLFVLNWPVEAINRRINARVREMIAGGLVEEVARLKELGVLAGQPAEALGYKQVLDHLESRCDLAEAIERTRIETRRYAKNQRTWLRRLAATPGTTVIAMADDTSADQIAQVIATDILR